MVSERYRLLPKGVSENDSEAGFHLFVREDGKPGGIQLKFEVNCDGDVDEIGQIAGTNIFGSWDL